MRAVAIKKGQSREKVAGFQEMSSSCTIQHSWISGLLKNKHIGSKRFLLKSTSAIGSTPTKSSCRTSRH